MLFEDFSIFSSGSHLVQWSIQQNHCGHLGFPTDMILAGFDPEVILLLQSKFRLSDQRFGKRCRKLISKRRGEVVCIFQHFSHTNVWSPNKCTGGRPRWLSWMRRSTGDQEVAGSTPAEVGNILSWRLIMKYFLRSFSPFH